MEHLQVAKGRRTSQNVSRQHQATDFLTTIDGIPAPLGVLADSDESIRRQCCPQTHTPESRPLNLALQSAMGWRFSPYKGVEMGGCGQGSRQPRAASSHQPSIALASSAGKEVCGEGSCFSFLCSTTEFLKRRLAGSTCRVRTVVPNKRQKSYRTISLPVHKHFGMQLRPIGLCHRPLLRRRTLESCRLEGALARQAWSHRELSSILFLRRALEQPLTSRHRLLDIYKTPQRPSVLPRLLQDLSNALNVPVRALAFLRPSSKDATEADTS